VEYPIEPFVISGEGVLTPPDRDRWVTKEMVTKAGGLPVFTVQQVSEVFFGKSATWLRKRLSSGRVGTSRARPKVVTAVSTCTRSRTSRTCCWRRTRSRRSSSPWPSA
jgi:hypothetical protein